MFNSELSAAILDVFTPTNSNTMEYIIARMYVFYIL